MTRPDWLIDPRLRVSGHRNKGDQRLVANCGNCRAYKRVGGKLMTGHGFKAMLTFLERHRHTCKLTPLEMFKTIFFEESDLVKAMAEKWWDALLAERMLKEAGVDRTKN